MTRVPPTSAVVVLAAAVVLAGCGATPSTAPGSVAVEGPTGAPTPGIVTAAPDASPPPTGDPDTPVSSGPLPAPSPGATQPQPRIVEPRRDAVDPRPVPWDDATVGEDGRTVTVAWWSGVAPCAVLDHVDVEEAPGAVTVTVYEGSSAATEAVACIEIAVFKATRVTLDAPLGDRELRDGAETGAASR